MQTFAIKESARCYERLRESFESDERALHFVGHQANLRMLEAVCERCGIDRERHHSQRRVVRQHRRGELGLGALDELGEVGAARRRRGGRRRRGAHLVELSRALRRRRVKYARVPRPRPVREAGAARLRARQPRRGSARGLRDAPAAAADADARPRARDLAQRQPRAHRRRARRAPRRLVLPVPLPGRSGAARLPRRRRRLAAARLLLLLGGRARLRARARLRRGRVLRPDPPARSRGAHGGRRAPLRRAARKPARRSRSATRGCSSTARRSTRSSARRRACSATSTIAATRIRAAAGAAGRWSDERHRNAAHARASCWPAFRSSRRSASSTRSSRSTPSRSRRAIAGGPTPTSTAATSRAIR